MQNETEIKKGFTRKKAQKIEIQPTYKVIKGKKMYM